MKGMQVRCICGNKADIGTNKSKKKKVFDPKKVKKYSSTYIGCLKVMRKLMHQIAANKFTNSH